MKWHFPGAGIVKGMRVTMLNLIQSTFSHKRLVTVSYPEQREALPQNSRNFPFLVYDGEDAVAGLRCVACKICEKECPPQCIYIVEQRGPDGKVTKHPEVFDIDISVCMSCQICVEVCPFDAIKMDQEFELAAEDRFDTLLHQKARLSKSNSYYHRIHPVEAAETDQRLAAKQNKKKP